MRIASVEIYPFLTSLLRPVRGRAERAGWRLRIGDASGRTGAGEAVCWPGFGAGERATSQALERLEGLLSGARFSDADSVEAWLADAALPPEVAHALCCALLDLLAQRAQRPFAALLGEVRRAQVPCQILVADAREAQDAVAAGYRDLKVKVGSASLTDDFARLRSIRAAVGPELALRPDANGRWQRAATLAALAADAGALRLTCLEQPFAPGDLEGLAALRAAGHRVAIDEGVTCLADLEQHLAAGAIDVLVLKPAFLGGPLAALRLAERAAQAGLEVSVTHALDGEVGRLAALHLALVVPALEVAGLAPALCGDLGPSGPTLRAPQRAGLGVAPSGAESEPARCEGPEASAQGLDSALASNLASTPLLPAQEVSS